MKRNWTKLYRTYSKHYNRLAKKSDVGMTEKYSKFEFKAAYGELEDKRLKQLNKGERKVLNITQDIVADQQKWEYSFKQAKALKQGLQLTFSDFDKSIRIRDIRAGRVDTEEFWKQITAYKNSLTNISGSNKAKLVGQVFFGSD